MSSPAAASAEVLWAASPEDTTATLSIGVPLDTEVAAAAAGAAAEALMDGARALFFGATTTLLLKDHMNQINTETSAQFKAKPH